nr:hypothetical protein C8R44DRAFT_887580 [Mycena epipterygia]
MSTKGHLDSCFKLSLILARGYDGTTGGGYGCSYGINDSSRGLDNWEDYGSVRYCVVAVGIRCRANRSCLRYAQISSAFRSERERLGVQWIAYAIVAVCIGLVARIGVAQCGQTRTVAERRGLKVEGAHGLRDRDGAAALRCRSTRMDEMGPQRCGRGLAVAQGKDGGHKCIFTVACFTRCGRRRPWLAALLSWVWDGVEDARNGACSSRWNFEVAGPRGSVDSVEDGF